MSQPLPFPYPLRPRLCSALCLLPLNRPSARLPSSSAPTLLTSPSASPLSHSQLFHHAATAELASADALFASFLQVNQRLAAQPSAQWPERLRKPLEKASAHGLFLGLDDYAWLDWL